MKKKNKPTGKCICKLLKFDPDCLENVERGPYGIKDLSTGKWLAYSCGKWFRAKSDSERTLFRSRANATDALCALEQRAWVSELAMMRPTLEKIAEKS